MIHETRIKALNSQDVSPSGQYVLYWMQAAQRARYNHALEHAISIANDRKQKLVVCFGLMDDYPGANLRHYAFMLQGLAKTQRELSQRGIAFTVRHGQPAEVALELSRDASIVIADRGYLRHQKAWRQSLGERAHCRVIQVESDVIVPVEVASRKEEFAARTLRPKLHVQLAEYLKPLKPEKIKRDSLDLKLGGLDLSDVNAALDALKLDRSVPISPDYHGGSDEAQKMLDVFLARKINDYPELRNEPSKDYVSHLSPYLHFGQISPLDIALQVHAKRDGIRDEAREAFLEELIVRRELSMNFCNYNDCHDRYECLPAWAIHELESHASDPRQPSYTLEQLEAAKTYDPYWNASQLEMMLTGKMHNYMRMYWGKKILEWVDSPRKAFEIAVHLNDKFNIDGRDPNSYAGVSWVFGKHDRPWAKRKIFGSVRYMNDKGLERKCDIKAYVRKIDAIQSARSQGVMVAKETLF